MKNKDFFKGLIYGVIFTLIVSLVLNTGCILFRKFVTKEINYETKAKSIYKLMKNQYVGDIDKDKIISGELLFGLYVDKLSNVASGYIYGYVV